MAKSKTGTFGAKSYGLKDFEDLQTSTMTVMVYANTFFFNDTIFKNIDLTEVDVPLTKKQKNVDKKKIKAPYGAIISVQLGTKIRGVDLRKKKKHWCTICQPYKIVDDKEMKVFTITEHLEHDEGTKDIFSIMHYCSRCQKNYRPEETKKINHFLNQFTAVVSIGENQPLLNIMMFKDNLKIAGCKSVDDAVEVLLILWQDHMLRIPDAFKLKKGGKNHRFVFEPVMRNVDFKLGFPIERPALNYLMNEDKFRDKIHMSQYESTGHTNVNIKMFSVKPPGYKYDCLIIPSDTKRSPFFIKLDNIPYRSDKKNQKDASKAKYVTFIVFSSSEIILSGRYNSNMKEMYNFFVQTAFTNREEIEEHLEDLDQTVVCKIKKPRAKKVVRTED